jgi:hypothetical protein
MNPLAGPCQSGPFRAVNEVKVVKPKPGENIGFLLQAQRLVVPRPASVGIMRIEHELTSQSNELEGEQLVVLEKPSERPLLGLAVSCRFVSFLSWRT